MSGVPAMVRDADSPTDGAGAPPPGVEAVRRRRPHRFPAAWKTALLAVVGVLVSVTPVFEHQAVPLRLPQSSISRALADFGGWTMPAAPVQTTLFGVTLNSSTGAMPEFRVGAVRMWDSSTKWADIQPNRGEFDWSNLDRLVNGARRAGLPALFVMGGTPRWASPAGPAGPYPGGSRTSPPDRLDDWDRFVTALAERYRGRVEAYELWVLANDRRFYSGSMETLIAMTRRASRIIRKVDPGALLVCPGMGRLWSAEGRALLRRFAELGGYDHCDVAGIKLHQRTAADPPETMLQLAATADDAFHRAGVHPRLWSTGTTYDIPLQGTLEGPKARDYAVRFYLTGLYARQLNVERMYFYNWGGAKIPIVLQAEGRPPTAAARAVEQLQRWLAHARGHSCGHGQAARLPANVWRCEFTIDEPGRHHGAAVVWTDTGTATLAMGGSKTVRRLDGSATAVRAGDGIRITEEPVLVELLH
ncbi:endo-1,4-beta-xylanase [Nonomuraea lactucae]|uniref:endo-1,4-beta-xylanase n=1 Tax=Nonomuraea lactucae TaxID=2249762 RepID=UPI001F06BECE|nr:endo-1,4-beta-xylanase [Nonomuraea lactucae]